MTNRLKTPFLALVCAIVVSASAAAGANKTSGKEVERTVESMLARMTLEEKIGQLHFPSLAFPWAPQIELARQGRIGAMLNVVDPRTIRDFDTAARQSRLGIPLLFAIDAIWAFRISFPTPIAWAATWRPELAEAAAEAIAREAAATGINWTFAPMVDVSRDPRWGRVIESAGEDAFLGSAFAAARVRGYRKGGLATSVKHFVGYGAPEGGRDYNGAEISTPELFDRYLPPFRAALEAGSDTVMASFNTINGVPVTADRRLINGLLKERLGFDGFVTSDFVAIGELMNHGVAATLAEGARKAILAGIDMDMESNAYHRHLTQEIATGRVPRAALDEAVRRVLRVKVRLGLFDKKPLPPPITEADVRKTARNVARESFVLLKNDGEKLPITPSVKTIALIGTGAETTNDHSWYGPATLTKPETQSLVDALRARLRPGQDLHYVKGYNDACGRTFADKHEAVVEAKRADVVVLVVTEDCDVNGEGASRTSLGLSGMQQEMLEALVETGKPIVLVVETGRPLTLGYADKYAASILVAWNPGTEGRAALAEVLLGEVSPSGKLPMTFPRSVGQIPIAYNSLPTSRPWTGSRYTSGYVDEAVTPLYPFGHGLSYTDFVYDKIEVGSACMKPDGEIEVAVTLRNAGSRKGGEVVQLYTRQLVASRSRPVRELKAFRKVELKPGQTRTVHFQLKASELGFHDDEGRYLVEPGPFKIFAGGSSAASLSADFSIVGK